MTIPDWQSGETAARELASTWHQGPGGAIALFGPAGLHAAAAGGFASLEHRVPFSPNTPSRYASISKQFMAATLLLEGVDLTRTLADLIPGFDGPLSEPTLGRALDMTAGLPDMMEALWQLGTPFTATLDATTVMRTLRRLPRLSYPAGSEMAYSNTGWRLAQSVVAARCGADYGTVLNRGILQPLGLGIAFPTDETVPVPGLATGYWRSGDTWVRGRYGMHFSASGGLAGSAEDLSAWGAALLADRFPGLLDALAAPRSLTDGTPSPYRLGLVESSLGGARILTHGGSLPGYRNVLLLAPEAGCGVALLTNQDADALQPGLAILAAMLGVPPPAAASASPSGLFATPDGPFWADLQPGAATFMGASETLLDDGAGGWTSLPSSLPISIEATQDGIAGRFGGATRAMAAVPPGLPLDPALIGTWREQTFGSELQVHQDGTATFPGTTRLDPPVPLTPLPGRRALATLPHGPWAHRPCLCLLDDGTLQLASHRSRWLRHHRA